MIDIRSYERPSASGFIATYPDGQRAAWESAYYRQYGRWSRGGADAEWAELAAVARDALHLGVALRHNGVVLSDAAVRRLAAFRLRLPLRAALTHAMAARQWDADQCAAYLGCSRRLFDLYFIVPGVMPEDDEELGKLAGSIGADAGRLRELIAGCWVYSGTQPRGRYVA